MTYIVRFDPSENLACLQRDINPRAGCPTEPASARPWTPPVDIFEDQNEIVVKAELPGIKQQDIAIELTGDTLTIKGERRFEDAQRQDNYVRVERTYGQFQRSFTISVPVQSEAVSATFKDGLLEVRLPKCEAAKPKNIKVAAV